MKNVYLKGVDFTKKLGIDLTQHLRLCLFELSHNIVQEDKKIVQEHGFYIEIIRILIYHFQLVTNWFIKHMVL